ncbi:hypothetical protein CBL_00056 [Carabus blaptoides fortunei]
MALLNRTLCKFILICLIIQCVFHLGQAGELHRHKRARTFDVASANSQSRFPNTETTTQREFNIIKAGVNCPPGQTPDHNNDCREEAFFSAISPNDRKAAASRNDKSNQRQ